MTSDFLIIMRIKGIIDKKLSLVKIWHLNLAGTWPDKDKI
jgi:hypothetical protein